jgi:hypothetical protein
MGNHDQFNLTHFNLCMDYILTTYRIFLPSGLGENRDPRPSENKDPQLTRTLINRLSKLEKRKEIMLIT